MMGILGEILDKFFDKCQDCLSQDHGKNIDNKKEIQYGLFDNLTIRAFYTEADDPLFKRIGETENQPENL